MHKKQIYRAVYLELWILCVGVTSGAKAAPSTLDYMNAMTACGLGAKSSVSNETKGTIRRQIDGDIASGSAVDDIVPKIANNVLAADERDHNYGLYDRYVACLKSFLKDGAQIDKQPDNKAIYIPERARGSYLIEADKLVGEKKYVEAITPLEQAAKLDFAEAKTALGVLYTSGFPGVPYKPNKAFELMTSAANQGYAPAYGRLAEFYYAGTGTKQDLAEAIKFAELGVQHNDMSAFNTMGELYYSGGGDIIQNDCKALEYYKKSSELGYQPAKIGLATMYLGGKCVEKDNRHAQDLLKSAAGAGNPDAVEVLKMMHEKGLD